MLEKRNEVKRQRVCKLTQQDREEHMVFLCIVSQREETREQRREMRERFRRTFE